MKFILLILIVLSSGESTTVAGAFPDIDTCLEAEKNLPGTMKKVLGQEPAFYSSACAPLVKFVTPT